jgi:hypothetical protein
MRKNSGRQCNSRPSVGYDKSTENANSRPSVGSMIRGAASSDGAAPFDVSRASATSALSICGKRSVLGMIKVRDHSAGSGHQLSGPPSSVILCINRCSP